jgi:hypothetical protein
MKIIFDTSALLQDPWLKNPSWEVLRAMVSVGMLGLREGAFVLPEVVYAEVGPAYRRRLLKEGAREVNKLLPSPLDLNALQEQLTDQISRTFPQLPEGAITVEHARSAVNRACNRLSPCSPEGEQVRDALIWEAVLTITKADPDRASYFFVGDGGFYKGNVMAPILAEECKQHGVDITLFKEIRQVIGWYRKQVDFITPEWLQDVFIPRVRYELESWLEGPLIEDLTACPAPLRMVSDSRPVIEYGKLDVYHHASAVLPDNRVALDFRITWPLNVEWELLDPIAPRAEWGWENVQISSGDRIAQATFVASIKGECLVNRDGEVRSLNWDSYLERPSGDKVTFRRE